MPNQIVLAWTVDVANTVFGPAQAAAALSAVELYENAITDPVLGQHFGLTVADDATTTDATSATRTLTLNMTNGAGAPVAPPPFPCRPRTSTPPELPYPLRSTKTLAGSFFVSLGSMSVATSASQVPSLSVGDSIQFLSQVGVFYEVASVSSTAVGLTAAYSGTSGNSGAFKEVADPVALDRLAVYSTSDLDTNAVATTPAIIPGSGARTATLIYNDSTGAGPFTTQASLTGRRPAAFSSPDEQGIDVAEIVFFNVGDFGGFENSVGEITLVSLSGALPSIPANATPGTGIGAAQGDRTFFALTDEAQLLIDRHLAYIPPSYFALAQQGAAAPLLDGDFILTTGSTNVPTTEDQSSALSASDIIEFADQRGTLYTVAAVTPKIVTLTTAYSGIDTNGTGLVNTGTNNNAGTKGNVGTEVFKKPSGARLVDPSPAAPPTNAQLAGPLAQFVAAETAMPPPNPPLSPATVAAPTFLSGLFTRTIQLALAGVSTVSETITFV